MDISIQRYPVMRTYKIPFMTYLSSALGLQVLALGGEEANKLPFTIAKLSKLHKNSLSERKG
jgi:hypothetical protein